MSTPTAIKPRLPITFLALALVSVLLAPLASPSLGLVLPAHTEKLQPDGPNSAMHGWSLASDGATMVVGAPGDSTHEVGGGSALVYEKLGGTWTEVQRLSPEDPQRTGFFGRHVAVDGDVIVAGSQSIHHEGVRTGAVYIFERGEGGTWEQAAKLVPADAQASDGFGRSVAVHEGRLAVGAFGADPAGSSSGAAYVFQRSEEGAWQQTAKLQPLDATARQLFGASVALEGDRLLVGAHGTRASGVFSSGAAYVFERDPGGAWSQVARLVAEDPTPVAILGLSVDLDGDVAIAGAPLARNGDGHTTGAGYLFERAEDGTWHQANKLLPEGLAGPEELVLDDTGAEPADSVGWDVAVEDGVAVVGSPDADDGPSIGLGANVGYAYAYVRTVTGWEEQSRLMALDAFLEGDGGDEFGFSVEVTGGEVLVGARLDETTELGLVGSVYVFPALGLPATPSLPVR